MEPSQEYKDKVHWILTHSYSFYLLLFLVGIFLDAIFRLTLFKLAIWAPVGVFFLLVGTILVYWAQKTSRHLKKETLSAKTFMKGPYKITRSPTHLGLFFLVLGFGLVANAFFLIVSSIISFIVTKLIFLKHEERILDNKYGAPYREYKKLVRF